MTKHNIELAKVLKMYNEENKNQGDIAAHYNCSLATMSNFFKKHNINVQWNKNRNYRARHNKEKIIQDYKTGSSMTQVAKIHRVGRNTILEYLVEQNTQIRSPRTYEVDENYFELINTPEKAYWLGFLYADGYNHQTKAAVVLILAKEDRDVLTNFKTALKSNIPIIDYNCREGVTAPRLTINSRKMSDDLAKHGCVQAKTLILKYPDIQPSLNSHFIRGYFDGDGCISVSHDSYSFEIAGTESLLLEMQEILIENCGFKKTKLSKRSNIYILRYGGNTQVKKIYDYLYKDASIFLERKKLKFDQLMQTVQSFRADYGELDEFTKNYQTMTQKELENRYDTGFVNIRGYAKRFKISRPKHLIDYSRKTLAPKLSSTFWYNKI